MGRPGSSCGNIVTAAILPLTRDARSGIDRELPTDVVYEQHPLQMGAVHTAVADEVRVKAAIKSEMHTSAARIATARRVNV